jgi:5-bromo-4-chloroindolyl phosphate hydrolysis protein
MIYYSVKRIVLLGNARRITQMARDYGGRMPVETAAQNLGFSLNEFYKDLGKMFALRYLANAEIDASRKEIVFSYAWTPKEGYESGTVFTEVNMISSVPAAVFVGVWINAFTFLNMVDVTNLCVVAALSIVAAALVFMAAPKCKKLVETERRPETVEAYNTGDMDVNNRMNEAVDNLVELGKLARTLAASNIGAQVQMISGVAQEILEHLKAHPEKLKNSRQFLNYYMPTSIKIFKEYAELTVRPVKTENIISSIKKIEEFTAGRVVVLFRDELDRLYLDKAVDISAEISVMEAMLPSSSGLQ